MAGLGNGDASPGGVGELVKRVAATVSIVGILPLRLWPREARCEVDSRLSRRKAIVRGAGASGGAARDGVGEEVLLRRVCVVGLDAALMGDAGLDVMGGTVGGRTELLVVGRECGTREMLDIVDPDPDVAIAPLAEISGAPLA